MISEDLKIVKKIFSILDEGIVNGYDKFHYEVEVHEGYAEEELTVERERVKTTNAETSFNGADLYSLVKQLKESALSRDENWSSFIMTYEQGGQVKTHFKYS